MIDNDLVTIVISTGYYYYGLASLLAWLGLAIWQDNFYESSSWQAEGSRPWWWPACYLGATTVLASRFSRSEKLRFVLRIIFFSLNSTQLGLFFHMVGPNSFFMYSHSHHQYHKYISNFDNLEDKLEQGWSSDLLFNMIYKLTRMEDSKKKHKESRVKEKHKGSAR